MSPMRVFGTTKRRFGNLSDFKCISSNINLFMLWELWVAEINPTGKGTTKCIGTRSLIRAKNGIF